ncbi:N5,N10-methylene tetrahydromethanopterin reductase [Nocardia neocaledoniensis NBRC 108232]|uniref:Luciferase-like monooxygenase n=1 Tax=Nocardia neocaledoniensis TaxID=236511 RepID=A0A317NWJ8_9NOCA|nr:LLM class flavin-dependent oxidoreductase [Nocardia neocaledoniensis]PWV79720.1 luciferase-like monooxygenase [Nocardia neocaledoniensis]GEM31506.1 N5,N10-methylene tetrahydromethanopterin reductase [Nocardia neocaledoniensis NBRC 108232]
MTDYGHEPVFGISIDPAAAGLDNAFKLARHADELGLDLLAVQDHAYQPSYLDAWTLLTYLSAATERISVMTDVADLQLRPPAMLAKAASSLAVLNGGRVQLGVGGGPFPDAIAGMGAAGLSGRAMVDYAEASVEILTRALAGGPVDAGNDTHRVSYVAGPRATTVPQVWVGAQKTRMLQLVGRRADGWIAPLNIYVPPEDVPEKQRIIDDAARSAGRDPAEVRRIYNVIGGIDLPARQGLVGDTNTWVEFLTDAVVDLGFDTFIFWPVAEATTQLDLFAAQIVPAVRERVAQIRKTR